AKDGVLRAYSAKDGSIFWEFNTNGEFKTVNGVPAKGASMIGPGPVIVVGMLFVNSGYAGYGGRSGNVLLALGVEEITCPQPLADHFLTLGAPAQQPPRGSL